MSIPLKAGLSTIRLQSKICRICKTKITFYHVNSQSKYHLFIFNSFNARWDEFGYMNNVIFLTHILPSMIQFWHLDSTHRKCLQCQPPPPSHNQLTDKWCLESSVYKTSRYSPYATNWQQMSGNILESMTPFVWQKRICKILNRFPSLLQKEENTVCDGSLYEAHLLCVFKDLWGF